MITMSIFNFIFVLIGIISFTAIISIFIGSLFSDTDTGDTIIEFVLFVIFIATMFVIVLHNFLN